MRNYTIGLFGTCGDSTWREKFIKGYEENGITFYNPQVKDWKPSCAVKEAEHLITDEIILFPVLGETYGMASLAEIAFAILNVINTDKAVVVLVDKEVSDEFQKANPQLAKESLNTRALVRAHLEKLDLENVYLVDNLDEMYETSLTIWNLAKEGMGKDDDEKDDEV
jgi:hypothetical protein